MARKALIERQSVATCAIGTDHSDLIEDNLRLSSLSDQAVVLMQAASTRCCGESLVNAAELAAATGIHVPTAQKLVSLLTRAGLLNSARGAGGGIRLTRPAAEISLADVVEAVEGPIALTACVEGIHVCERESLCAVKPHWSPVNEAVRGALAHVSLASLSAPIANGATA